MRIRNFVAGAVGALLAVGSLVLPATAANAASTAPAAGPAPASLKTCEATSGVGVVHSQFPSKPQPVDENVSVYVGGDFTRTAGAELEGQLVVNGNINLGSGLYNIGVVGAGSGVIPVSGQDIVRVGGTFTLGPRAEISSKAADDTLLPGNVKAGGAINTDANLVFGGGGAATQGIGRDAALGTSFKDWPNSGFSVLRDFAQRNTTGTPGTAAFAAGGYLDLTGTPGQTRHLFTIPGAQLTGQSLTLRLIDIAATDIIVINVTGPTAKLNINDLYVGSTQILMGDKRFGQTAARTLWTFPDATSVTISGGQVPGSVVVPTPGSTTTQAAGGSNGRYWVAGNLVQNYGGSEFHSFPFLGDDDSTCGQPLTPRAVDQETTPVDPAVTQSVCTAGTPSTPSVALPTNTTAIVYSKSGAETPGSTVTVSAVAQTGYVFPVTVTGWTVSADKKTATRTIVLDTPDCAATPVAPTVVQSVCVAGEPTAPSVTLPADTDRIAYTKSGAETPGSTVSVTATAKGEYRFPATVSGWTVSADRTTATRTVALNAPDCGAAPVNPTVVQSVCVAGQPSTPSVTLPADSATVTYAKSGTETPGSTVTVTATAKGEHRFPATVTGWTVSADRTTATQEIALGTPDCAATPVAPTVVQSVCEDGAPTTPSVTLPADGATVAYTKSGAETPGSTVTVTATAQGEYRFPASVEGWTISADRKTATQTISLDAPDCGIAPIAPTVTQSVCVAGQPSAPSVALPADTATIGYAKSGAETPGSTVTVTATAKGAALFSTAIDGWTVSADRKTATQEVVLGTPDCAATPVNPTVVQSVCVAGQPTAPSVALPADNDRVVYTKSGDEVPGGTVVATATAQGEYRFPATVGGWTVSADRTTATQNIVLGTVDCAATPVNPTVAQSVCVAGQPSTPSVTLPGDDARVAYTKAGAETPGSTVTVTATAQGEHRFPATVDGWTVSADRTTATQEVVLGTPDCAATPVNPTVVQSVCVAGQPSAPSVTLPNDGDRIVYTKTGAETPGSTVTVTATAQGEYRFPASVDGWTVSTDRTTATQEIALTATDCAAVPVAPVVIDSVCVAGQPTAPSVTIPENTDRVVYTKAGDEKPGSTVTVTATTQGEYRFPASVDGWTVSADRTTATQEIALAAPDCIATPAAPVVVDAVCEAGSAKNPTVTLPSDDDRIVYTKTGQEKPGSTVTITATAQGEYRFPATVDGWTVSEDRLTATRDIVLASPDCTVPPVAPKTPGSPLATTGSDPTALWLTGLGLLIAGGIALGLRRITAGRRP